MVAIWKSKSLKIKKCFLLGRFDGWTAASSKARNIVQAKNNIILPRASMQSNVYTYKTFFEARTTAWWLTSTEPPNSLLNVVQETSNADFFFQWLKFCDITNTRFQCFHMRPYDLGDMQSLFAMKHSYLNGSHVCTLCVCVCAHACAWIHTSLFHGLNKGFTPI